MKIKKLHIKNFKSLVDLEIVEPNPFTVFVGANGVGKSNIFEALELASFLYDWNKNSAVRLFGGKDSILSRNLLKTFSSEEKEVEIKFESKETGYFFTSGSGFSSFTDDGITDAQQEYNLPFHNEFLAQFLFSFGRIFVKNQELLRVREISSERLSIDCSNLEKVLKRLLDDELKREEITEYLQLFVPSLERVQVLSSELSGTETLLIFEKDFKKPFTKELISDGTYNILCLITAVFQSDEPQFLCIEEPENGLNPFVIKEFVNLFRNVCEEKGHYIWLNTHSQSLVGELTPEEIVLVDKVNGETKVKQIKGLNFHGLPTDEAWVSGALGGGVPW
ncbi:AAA family ATPase [Dyadobacter sp. 32]|uniref:AAA family ATPase n=1 Tax=Dyadobacter sp. 32 TaxID=538966 RepID=UPI0011ED2E8E